MSPEQAYALSKKYTKESLQGAGAIKGEDGFSPTITESQDNSDSEYRLNITDKNGTFKTPNLKGEKGEPGPTGAQGVQGIKGDRGQQGEQGIQGIQGIPGPKGDDGYPFLIYKEYATLSDFNAADFPEIGLMFMVKEKELGAFPVYRFTGDEEEPYSYVTGLSDGEGIKGEKGDPGEQGAQGIPGKDGKDGTTYTPAIGGVTSGETAAASVVLDEERRVAEFNFVLPKGEKGDNVSSVAIKADEEIFNGPIAANSTYSFSKRLDNFDEIWFGVFNGNNVAILSQKTLPTSLAIRKAISLSYIGISNNNSVSSSRLIEIMINDNDTFSVMNYNVFNNSIGDLIIRGIKYTEVSDVEGGGQLEISQESGNAIVKKEDGIYVEDKSDDIKNLQGDVSGISERIKNVKKYQRYVNTEMDYVYLQTDLVADLPLSAGTVVPFDKVVESKGIEINSENHGVVLKAGKSYEILCDIYISVRSGAANFVVYDLTNGKNISRFTKISANNNSAGTNTSGIAIVKAEEDTIIQIKTEYAENNIAIASYNITNNLAIKEINRSIVIDPVEHVNAESGIEDTPVGHILTHMGTKAPKHYLVCDGTEYPIADYPYLAQHFIDDFGSVNYFGGDGENTFAVPDLRGEFLRGSGTAERNTGSGEAVGQHQEATMIPYFWSGVAMAAHKNTQPQYMDKEHESGASNISGGGNYPTSNTTTHYTARPTNTSILYCIKYEPTYFMKVTGHVYSYEERLVGTWVDGKPLYEKTVDFGNLPNATSKEVPHGIENVDLIWIHDGYVSNNNTRQYELNTANTSDVRFGWVCSVEKEKIFFVTGISRTGFTATITLRYTKTTD